MLHFALTALLAGTLGVATLAGPGDVDKPDTPRAEAVVGFTADAGEQPLIDTYAYGLDEQDFLNIWAAFGWGQLDQRYDAAGNEQGLGYTSTAMRAYIGAHANLVRFGNMALGLGAQVMLGSTNNEGVGETGVGMHSAKVWAQFRGPVLGTHAGYIHDFETSDPADPVRLSDGLSAWFVGFSFDHQPDWLRLFGGTEMIRFIDFPGHNGTGWDSPSLLVFTLGGGVEFGFVELGVAGYWRTNLVYARIPRDSGGSHQRGLVPYLNLNPDFLPVGLSVRGALNPHYADYGFSIGGARDLVSRRGITVGLTFGV